MCKRHRSGAAGRREGRRVVVVGDKRRGTGACYGGWRRRGRPAQAVGGNTDAGRQWLVRKWAGGESETVPGRVDGRLVRIEFSLRDQQPGPLAGHQSVSARTEASSQGLSLPLPHSTLYPSSFPLSYTHFSSSHHHHLLPSHHASLDNSDRPAQTFPSVCPPPSHHCPPPHLTHPSQQTAPRQAIAQSPGMSLIYPYPPSHPLTHPFTSLPPVSREP